MPQSVVINQSTDLTVSPCRTLGPVGFRYQVRSIGFRLTASLTNDV
jgi:hypothetical protein